MVLKYTVAYIDCFPECKSDVNLPVNLDTLCSINAP